MKTSPIVKNYKEKPTYINNGRQVKFECSVLNSVDKFSLSTDLKIYI